MTPDLIVAGLFAGAAFLGLIAAFWYLLRRITSDILLSNERMSVRLDIIDRQACDMVPIRFLVTWERDGDTWQDILLPSELPDKWELRYRSVVPLYGGPPMISSPYIIHHSAKEHQQ